MVETRVYSTVYESLFYQFQSFQTCLESQVPEQRRPLGRSARYRL